MLWSSFISATGADYDSRVGPFSPTTIGAINVSNRIAMAPLTRARAGMDRVPSPLAVEYYRQRASAGLIISEATSVSQKGRGYAFKGRQLWKYLMSRRAPSLMSSRPARLRPGPFPPEDPAVSFP